MLREFNSRELPTLSDIGTGMLQKTNCLDFSLSKKVSPVNEIVKLYET